MARNDIFVNINSISAADAFVTGQQDMTAADAPELVLGDTPTFNFYFTDNTNVWPSWAGNAAYTVTWALSDAISGDFAPAAVTTNATPITGGWSIVLPLNSYDLVGLMNTKRISQAFPVAYLWQQVRVTDPSGNEITRAMVYTPVRYRAISDTQNTESASPTGGRFVAVSNTNVLTSPTTSAFYTANPVPTSALGTAANGELLIGNGTGFSKATLTAGTGVTVTNGSGSITIDATGAQELLTATVKNADSVTITKGQVVYLFGATGNMASVKLAYNTSDATSAKTFGVVASTSIAPNGTGTITCVGVLDGLMLGSFNDGDTVYLGATPGSLTATKPYAPNHLVYVGVVERANNGNGELYIKVQNGYELDEIHDVQITTPPPAGALLVRDNTLSLWKAARLTAGTNIAVTNADASVTVGLTGTVAVANGGTGVTSSTGTGSVVLSNSPTLVTPVLGTPQSGTLSSCTGLPISTGVSGLGSNVATFLATPSSANLAAAVTDETGSGALVFANTPTLITPNIGAATGTSVNLSGAGTFGGNLTVSGTAGANTLYGASNSQLILDTASGAQYTSLYWKNNGTQKAGIYYDNTGANFYIDGQASGSSTRLNGYNSTILSVNGAAKVTVDGTATTLAGNLTVSGTGTSAFANSVGGDILAIGNGHGGTSKEMILGYSLTGSGYGYIQPVHQGTAYTPLVLQPNGGNLLLGTTTDGGQKLQVAGTAAITGGDLRLSGYTGDSTQAAIFLNSAATSYIFNNGSSFTFRVSGADALRLYATRAEVPSGIPLRLGNAYTAGAPTATGYVTIQDSNGTTYKVLVGT